jgi:hypothetical protein
MSHKIQTVLLPTPPPSRDIPAGRTKLPYLMGLDQQNSDRSTWGRGGHERALARIAVRMCPSLKSSGAGERDETAAAARAAAVRFSTPSCAKMCSRCFSTVRGLTCKMMAISSLVFPCITQYKTSVARGPNPRGQYVGIKYSTLAYWLQSRRRHREREKLLLKAGADTEPGKSNGGGLKRW